MSQKREEQERGKEIQRKPSSKKQTEKLHYLPRTRKNEAEQNNLWPINSLSQRSTGFGGGTRTHAGAKVSGVRTGGIVGRGFRPKELVESSASDFAARKRGAGALGECGGTPLALRLGGSYPLRVKRHRWRFGFATPEFDCLGHNHYPYVEAIPHPHSR